MGNIERRTARLEDQLMPKKIILPSKDKRPFDEEGFLTVLNEFLRQYTPKQLKAYEKKLTEIVKGPEA